MASHDPTTRTLVARTAALTRWAHADGIEGTAAARKAFLDGFEREVDPDGILDPVERAKRAARARRAHFTRLALKSAQARKRRAS